MRSGLAFCRPRADRSRAGYLFNIQFLRRIFNPTFTLHDLRQTGPNDITTRWTMRMEFALTRCAAACGVAIVARTFPK